MDDIPRTNDLHGNGKPLLPMLCPYGAPGSDRAQEIIDTFDCLIYVCSDEYKIEFVNDQLMMYIGRDVTGERCHAALFGRDSVCPWCRHPSCRSEKTIRHELDHASRRRWYFRMKTPLYAKDGSLSMLVMLRDITAEKTATRALRESERKFKTLMSNLPGMAFRCDIDEIWTLRFASDGCERLLGYLPAELLASREQLVHAEDLALVREQINRALQEKERYQITYRIRVASGQLKWVIEHGQGVYSEGGDPLLLEGYLTDISEQKKNELRLQKENSRLKHSIREIYRFCDIIGKSAVMQGVYGQIIDAANSNANVIVLGESGTGKELVARAIHDLSERSEHRFVTVNCGAIPESLFESEFFGYKKGAFTDAHADKKGYLDAAHQGTLFLDEIGEISLGMQIKLLRAIEGYGYLPVGGHELNYADFRIIAATNRDLLTLVKTGRMRADFYYRINILPIELPPLRKRKEDIPLLIDHFISEARTKTGPAPREACQTAPDRVTARGLNSHGQPLASGDLGDFLAGKKRCSILGQRRRRAVPPLSEREKSALVAYDWPGNVRELKNMIERYFVSGSLGFMKRTLLRHQGEASPPMAAPLGEGGLREAMEQVEKSIIVKALERNQWRRSPTAKELKITTRTLQRKINTYGLRLASG